MRHRRAFLSFPQEHGSNADLLDYQKVLAGLNIAFKVDITSQEGFGGTAAIDIYNLNRDDMSFLATTSAQWVKQQALVQLYVGYDDDVKMVFGGIINEATPEGYPDLVLHIRAQSGPSWTTKAVNVDKMNLKVMDLIDYASTVTGYPVNIPVELRNGNEMLNTRLDRFSYTGSTWGLLDKIQDLMGGFNISENNVFLSTYNDQINVWSPAGNTQPGGKLLISKETGLIGVPHIVNSGVVVKTLLNNSVKVGDTIHLESERAKIATGDYFVKEICHEGELRGNNWYTTLKCSFTVAKTKGNTDAEPREL